jgi:hypothetical protein
LHIAQCIVIPFGYENPFNLFFKAIQGVFFIPTFLDYYSLFSTDAPTYNQPQR